MTQKALRRKKVSTVQITHLFFYQNKKQKQEAKKEKANQEEKLLRESALNQIAGVEESKQQEKVPETQEQLEIEYATTNELDELGSSKAYAELMQVFERFDQQAAQKLDQAADASMGPPDQAKSDAKNAKENEKSKPGANKEDKETGNNEAKMTKKQRKQLA